MCRFCQHFAESNGFLAAHHPFSAVATVCVCECVDGEITYNIFKLRTESRYSVRTKHILELDIKLMHSPQCPEEEGAEEGDRDGHNLLYGECRMLVVGPDG